MAVKIGFNQNVAIVNADGKLTRDGALLFELLTQAVNDKTTNFLRLDGPLNTYTVLTVPDATTAGKLIYVSDEAGGAVPAFSDGVAWRRVTDRAVVS